MRYIEAVRAQGKSLRASRAAVTGRLDGLDLAPWRNRRLAVTGMGASSNAIAAVLGAYWQAGLPASGWLGSELELAGPASGAEAVIAVSQTGKSAEIHSALQHLPDGCARLAVTDAEDSPIAGLADATIPLALLEDSAVRTIGYTGTVQALLLLRDALAPGHAPAADWDQLADDLELQQEPAEELAQRLRPALRGVTAFDVVGSGMHAGTAAQGALLLREVCKLPASGYETYQYLHGPVEAAGTGRALIAIGGPREARLAASMAAAGATALLITAADTATPDQPGLTIFRLPQSGQAQAGQAQAGQAQAGQAPAGQAPADLAQAVLAILPLQAITWLLAEDLGCTDGEFLYHQNDTKVG
jgi:glucosamine--fructose-6-phosphate aminotransferase (isomerizing)